MKRSIVLFAVATLLTAMIAGTASAARKTQLGGTAPERLFALTAETEKIAVIVGVHVEGGWDVSATRIPEKAARQREKARETKERILRNHPAARRVADRDFQFIPYYVLIVDAKTLRGLMNDDDVVSIEENSVGDRTLVESTAKISSRAANLRGYTGVGTTVVVIDDGVERNHPFLAGNMYDTEGACFSGIEFDGYADNFSVCPNGQTSQPNNFRTEVNVGRPCPGCYHGTQVAGVIAGKSVANNMYGVAPEADLFPIQVFSRNGGQCGAYPCTRVRKADVIAALEYVHMWAPYYQFAAVNMSLDFRDTYASRTACINQNGGLRNAIVTLYMDDIAVVVASGNQGAGALPSSPSCIDYTYTVGATTDSDTIASYSSIPTWLSFFAPGGSAGTGNGITTSANGGGYIETYGTSMAAPHVSGAFALLRQRLPNVAVNWLYLDLRNTGTMIALPGGTLVPRINVDAALNE